MAERLARPLLVLAAGGTGGHMFPAQALAEEMLARGWRVVLSTDARGARYAGGFPAEVEIRQARSATFARGGLLARALVPFRILGGVAATLADFLRQPPDMVVGFGGYPAIPALSAAWLLRRPRMIHEQNGVLGRVNRLFARRVGLVACGIWPTDAPQGARTRYLGNPVRGAVRARAGAGYIVPGDYPMTLLVIGGSQGARILSDIVPPAIASLPLEVIRHLRVFHQARAEDHDRVSAFYLENGIRAEVQPFFADIPDRMAEAQLVISRAGASSIADLTVIGRPAILVPFAAATGDHQTANATGAAEAGGAVVLPEATLSIDAMSAAILRVLQDPAAARGMASAMRALGRPDAARDLADTVEALARGVLPATGPDTDASDPHSRHHTQDTPD